ncbi:MAG: hypothetical protein LC118_13240 [Dehalococcoidia bacterium]|nr:hypothetical protein [Dehalococcoidia bacterium]
MKLEYPGVTSCGVTARPANAIEARQIELALRALIERCAREELDRQRRRLAGSPFATTGEIAHGSRRSR